MREMVIDVLRLKSNFPGASETLMDGHLERQRKTLAHPLGSATFQKLAKLLPRTFKQCLSLLEHLNVLKWPIDHVYTICSKCACPYRGPNADARSCPNPACARPANHPRYPAMKMIVRSPIEYARQLYSNKEVAKLLKTWKERRAPPGGLVLATRLAYLSNGREQRMHAVGSVCMGVGSAPAHTGAHTHACMCTCACAQGRWQTSLTRHAGGTR